MTDPTAGGEAPTGAGRFAANAVWMVAGQAVAKIGSFAFVLVVTRGLGATAYGQFNFAVSFVPLFLIVGTWGLESALIGEIGRDRRRFPRLLASALVIRVSLGSAALVLSLLFGIFFVRSGAAYFTLLFVGLALLFDEATNLLGAAFEAFERMAYFSIALVVNRIASTVLAVLAVAAGGGIVAVSGMYLLGSASALVAAVFVLRRTFPPVHVRDARRETMRSLLHRGAPLGLAAALNMAVFRVDAVLLQAIDGMTAVGMYGVAFRFLDSFLFVAYGLGVVAMPRIARSEWSAESERGFSAVLALMLAFYAPLAVGGLFFGRWAVTLLFGERYAEASGAVHWLAAAAGFYAVAYLCRFSVVILGKRHRVAVIAGVMLGVNVLGNLVAIPRYGYRGAAAVTFLTEVLEAIVLVVYLRRTVGGLRLHGVVAAPLLAAGVMAGAVALTGRQDAAGVVVGVVAYIVALVAGALILAPDESRRLGAMLRVR